MYLARGIERERALDGVLIAKALHFAVGQLE